MSKDKEAKHKKEGLFTEQEKEILRELPTYHAGNRPYDKYTEKPAPVAENPKL